MKTNSRVSACQLHQISRNKIAINCKNRDKGKNIGKGVHMIMRNRHALFVASMPQIYRRGMFGWL